MATVVAPDRCKLCGSTALKSAFTETYKGHRYTSWYCRACDVYQSLGELAAVSPDYVGLTSDELVGEHVFLQSEHKQGAFAQWASLMARHSGRPVGGASETRSVLDIGCGVGGFLDFAGAAGLATFGFDASDAQAAAARQRHPNARHGIDLDAYVAEVAPGRRFDFITMWDVLEHIREPARLLEAAARHLAPGGLMFVSVPSGGPLPAKLVLTRTDGSAGLIPWEHVFYYTKRSLPRVFGDNGFAVREVGGVATYDRRLTPREAVRRLGHRVLRSTPWAFQIFVVASPAATPQH